MDASLDWVYCCCNFGGFVAADWLALAVGAVYVHAPSECRSVELEVFTGAEVRVTRNVCCFGLFQGLPPTTTVFSKDVTLSQRGYHIAVCHVLDSIFD